MKKGILQRVSKNWEETKMGNSSLNFSEFDNNRAVFLAPPPEVKQEPIADYPEPLQTAAAQLETSKLSQPTSAQRPAEVKKVQRDSMITVRKDYSYKYSAKAKTPTRDKPFGISPPIASPSSSLIVQSNKKELSVKPSPALFNSKRLLASPKQQISILERYDYDKAGPSKPKLLKMDNKASSVGSSNCAIASTRSPSPAHHPSKSHVPMQSRYDDKPERVNVFVAQKVESPVVKLEPDAQLLKSPIEPKDPQNINKINNKINIIFQLNDNTKSLRKNIILHRRAPKKMVQKITIKETNNNTKMQPDDASSVPDRVLCSIDTQTEFLKQSSMHLTLTNPLCDEPTEHLFFEDDILISLQQSTISFFEYNRLSSLLKKGESDFRLIDRVPRRLHDTLIDADNKYQRLCYNDQNSLPIYVEMRGKQKELDDPDLMCPIAFLYCNVYYIDQRRAKFSSVHLDTVKSLISDIIYTTVPGSSYFIMAWNEMSLDLKTLVTGIVKYKLTPNLDLAKLASIRQFPKLNYRTKQMNCGIGSLTRD